MLPSPYQVALWNTFRSVRINGQHATLVFVLHSHIEFYLTYQCHKLNCNLTDIMDIDETQAKDSHTCRVALRPPSEYDQTTALVLTITFDSAPAYDRFVGLLVRSEVFYYCHSKSGSHSRSKWFGNLRRHQNGHHQSEQQHSELKLVPSRAEQLRNHLHLLADWKGTRSF